jgi:hypothetical protein
MTENNGMDRDDGEQDSTPDNPYEDVLNELAVVANTMSVRQEYPSDYGVQQSGLFYVGLMLCRRLDVIGEKAEQVDEGNHFLGVATLDTLEHIEKLIQKARDSGGSE